MHVRPIGVDDVPRRIIAKAILHVIGNDIQLSARAVQTCAGHDAGSEAIIHAMRVIFEDIPILMQLSLLMLQMYLILLTVKLSCTTSLYCGHPFLWCTH